MEDNNKLTFYRVYDNVSPSAIVTKATYRTTLLTFHHLIKNLFLGTIRQVDGNN